MTSGIKTGLFLQLAIGPVFFYLVSIAVESNLCNSFMAVTAVTIVDYLYIGLSILGIGAGAATFFFLGATVSLIAVLKANIPDWLVQSMNCLVGLILIYYGVTRTIKFFRSD